ncbi:MAG: metallophosphoesterase family protein [Eubacteriaceae bacterium]
MLKTFIHTGDFHLGRPFTFRQQGSYYGRDKRKEIWQSLETIVGFANREKIPLILMTGDLFDSVEVLTMDVKRVSDLLNTLEETRVVIVTGNHDYHGEKSPYKKTKWPPNVYIFGVDKFESIFIEELNTEIFGFSWVKNKYPNFPEEAFKKIKLNDTRYNILMIHGDIAGGEYLPLDVNLIEKKGFNAIALGHIHKPGITPNGTAYCGSPIPLNFGETGDHGFLISNIEVDYDKHKFVTTNQLSPISSRKYVTKDIQIVPENTYNDILEKVINCDPEWERQKYYYRIRFYGFIDPEIHLEWINDDIEDAFYYVEIETNQLELDIDFQKLLKENQGNQIGDFLNELRMIEDPTLRKKAILFGIEAMAGEGVLQ